MTVQQAWEVPGMTGHRPVVAPSRGVGHGRIAWRLSRAGTVLLVTTLAMQVFGLLVLYSASSLLAVHEGRAAAHYVVQQGIGVVAGLMLLWITSRIDAEWWRRWAWPIFFATAVALLVCILPGAEAVAPRINGSRRWVRVFGVLLQPGEVAKVAVVLWTAMMIVRKSQVLNRLSRGLVPFVIGVGALAVLAALEPDLSMAMFYGLLMCAMLFLAGVPVGHFLWLGVAAIPLLWREFDRLNYVMMRILGFLGESGASASQSVNYQLEQSLIAIGSGGWTGVGYGRGLQQSGFLPYPFSDFIGSNIGEEWGVLGLVAVTVGWLIYGFAAMRVARAARSEFQRLVVLGFMLSTVLTALIHIAVVVGALPTTGLTLPLISYGRTNLLVTYFTTGVMLNVASRRENVTSSYSSDSIAASTGGGAGTQSTRPTAM